MTGVDFNNKLDLIIDRPYSRYYSPPQRNDFIEMAINNAINNRTVRNDTIITADNLFGIYKSNVIFTPTTNTISLVSGGSGISDYFHMMNVQAKYVIPVSVAIGNSVYITEATNSTPIRIKLNVNTNLRQGSQVDISGVTGNTNTNGIRFLKAIGNKWFELYADEPMLTPIVGNGVYSGTSGSIMFVAYNFASPLKSNHKFSKLGEATTDNPLYEIADGVVKIYPLDRVCSEATIDYISTPVYIDVTDAVTDLNATYSESFLNFIMQETAVLMGMSSRDNELTNNAAIIIQQS